MEKCRWLMSSRTSYERRDQSNNTFELITVARNKVNRESQYKQHLFPVIKQSTFSGATNNKVEVMNIKWVTSFWRQVETLLSLANGATLFSITIIWGFLQIKKKYFCIEKCLKMSWNSSSLTMLLISKMRLPHKTIKLIQDWRQFWFHFFKTFQK